MSKRKGVRISEGFPLSFVRLGRTSTGVMPGQPVKQKRARIRFMRTSPNLQYEFCKR